MKYLKETLEGLKITGDIQKQVISKFEDLRSKVLDSQVK